MNVAHYVVAKKRGLIVSTEMADGSPIAGVVETRENEPLSTLADMHRRVEDILN